MNGRKAEAGALFTGVPRLSTGDFLLDGAVPDVAIAPASQEAMAEALKVTAQGGLCAVPWGGGQRQEMGNLPLPYDVAISTGALSRVVAIEPGDLTATVEAGITLASLQTALAEHGQFVALESPAPDRETIGGILATASSGILRFGYGAPRDQLIGVTVAMTDGSLVRAGGRVVKNVAGYDLCKLFTGSSGTLGVIVEATFRVRPLPLSTRTWVGAFSQASQAEEAVARLMDSDLQPSFLQALDPALSTVARQEYGLDAAEGAWLIMLGADGDDALSRWMAEEAGRQAAPQSCQTVTGEASTGLRRWLTAWTAPQSALCLRLSVLGSRVFALMDAIRQQSGTGSLESRMMASAGNGVVYFHASAGEREPDPDRALSEAVSWLIARAIEYDGSGTVLRSPARLRDSIEMWGPQQPTEPLMRRIRDRFDPAHCLNRGRLFRDERSLSVNPGSGV